LNSGSTKDFSANQNPDEVVGLKLQVDVKYCDQFQRTCSFYEMMRATDCQVDQRKAEREAERQEKERSRREDKKSNSSIKSEMTQGARAEEDEAARVYDSSTVDVVYLKAINVPTMYDVGTLPVDPTDGRLCLNIMDLFNYHKVVKPDFQKLRMQKSKVSKLRQVM
jgi:hypothetical protein